MFRLVFRNLLQHPLRSSLTVASLTVAIALIVSLRSLVTTLNAGVDNASQRRLWVQSAVSLFVQLPIAYQPKIERVEGVRETCKWQWFGALYQDESNFFGQFACDKPELLAMWPEVEIIDGSAERFLSNRTGCMIGEALAKEFDWKVGQTIPLIGALFPHPDGGAWQFVVEAVYRPSKPALDDRTLFFGWDYYEETLRPAWDRVPDVGVIVIEVAPGHDVQQVIATVDAMFENDDQRVETTTESEFTRQFVTMIGELPTLMAGIGGAVFVAILLAVINTMLMAGREQTRDIGILKALGFTDGAAARMLVAQSLILCVTGGGLGLCISLAVAPAIRAGIQQFFPGYLVHDETLLMAAAIVLGLGFLAGVVPALNARRLRCVQALRQEE